MKKDIWLYHGVNENEELTSQHFEDVTDVERDGTVLSFTDDMGVRHMLNGHWEVTTTL